MSYPPERHPGGTGEVSAVHRLHRWGDRGPGDVGHVPPGGIHGLRNESGEPASMLILFTPGAPREGYFKGLAAIADGGERPGEEKMSEFCLRHDNHWTDRRQ